MRGGMSITGSNTGRKVLICEIKKNKEQIICLQSLLHTELKADFKLFFVATLSFHLIITVNYVKLPKAHINKFLRRKHWIIITVLQFLPRYLLKVFIDQVKYLIFLPLYKFLTTRFISLGLRQTHTPDIPLPGQKKPPNPTPNKKCCSFALALRGETYFVN